MNIISKLTTGLLCVLCSLTLSAQQTTFRILQYNLLNYAGDDNPTSYKDPRLKTIVDYVQPDIFGANEIADNAANITNIATNVLNSDWDHGTYSNTNHQIQINMLFWKKAKFGLISQTVISHVVRDIIAFKLYYKDSALYRTRDTVYLTIMVGHLKAGDASSDSTERASETHNVAAYLNGLNKGGNYIYMGDCNLYTSAEQAYQNLVANPNLNARLYDPINRPGDWHSLRSFADIHTQATRTDILADGGSNGGLDDRFDHMIVSSHIMKDSSRIMYVTGTYKAVGQDGQHFNRALNSSPTNTAAPSDVIQALYEMSDHLPICADYTITPSTTTGVVDVTANHFPELIHIATDVQNQIAVRFDQQLVGKQLALQVYAIDGKTLLNKVITVTATLMNINIENEINKPGMYLFKATDGGGNSMVSKFVKH